MFTVIPAPSASVVFVAFFAMVMFRSSTSKVVVLRVVVVPWTVKLPETVRLSSIRVSPVALSNIKSKVSVSISFAFVIPICISLIVAPFNVRLLVHAGNEFWSTIITSFIVPIGSVLNEELNALPTGKSVAAYIMSPAA